MSPTPEQRARERIDSLLEKAGWQVVDAKEANLQAGRGVAIREFPLEPGHGFADYLLYVDGKAAGVIEAKKVGSTLSGVEVQSRKYTEGLPEALPAWHRPLAIHYQSTGVETRINNRLDPEPRARNLFAFHRPEHLVRLLEDALPPSPLAGEGRGEGDAQQARRGAVKPLHDPQLRNLLVELKKKNEITIDHVSQDQVIEAGFSQDALDRARGLVESFEAFLEEHKDEITALQVLYSRPYAQRLTFEAVQELVEAIEKPPYLWNGSQLWQAYAALEKSKVRGAGGKRILTDLVSLVRFAMHQENELVPFPERVNANFRVWLAEQEQAGRHFTVEQRRWLEMIRDHIAGSLGIDLDDFELSPFAQAGGLGKVFQLFGDELAEVVDSLSQRLTA